MKYYYLAILFLVATLSLYGQERVLPRIELKDLSGKSFSTEDISNDNKPVVICFWATWCKPCIEELTKLHELYPDWSSETGVKILAVSIDDSRTSKKVAPFIRTRGWLFDIYLDENSDFRRSMGVTNPPHSFLLDSDNKVVYEHIGYAPGDENDLLDKIRETLNKTEE